MSGDIATLAKGGRTNFFGFLLRLGARLPFLFIAGRLYGAEPLGRFAYATMVVELAAALATIGLKRGLAQALARSDRPHPQVVADAMLLAMLLAAAFAGLLAAFPQLLYPSDANITMLERAFPFIAVAIVGSDVALAALAYRHRIGPSVAARSIVEPWVLTIVATALAFTVVKGDGLLIAYAVSLAAAFAWSVAALLRDYGLPHGWRPDPARMARLARQNAPIAGADIADWASRKLDLFILGRFAPPEITGIYYVAQQVATLPAKLRSSFDPILAPLLTKALADGDGPAAAGHLRQVGFWVGAAQLAIVLALGLPAEGVMGLFGPAFAAGATAAALLLVAELVGAQAAVAETGLIYRRPLVNLWLSLAGLALQAGLTVWLVQLHGPWGGAVGAALALALALLAMSIAKARVARTALGARVAGWRWSMLGAAVPAFAIGLAMRQTPEPVMLAVGIPLILASFCWIIWRVGFEGNDRVLFKRLRS